MNAPTDQSVLLAQAVSTVAQLLLAVVLARLIGGVALAALARGLARGRGATERAQRIATAGARLSPRCARPTVAAIAGAGLVIGIATAPAGVAGAGPRPGPGAGTPRPAATATVPVIDRWIDPVLTGGSASWREPSAAVRVRSGDSLWSIAARSLGSAARPAAVAVAWPRWYARNRAVIGPDPALLIPGQRLVAPGAPFVGTTSRDADPS